MYGDRSSLSGVRFSVEVQVRVEAAAWMETGLTVLPIPHPINSVSNDVQSRDATGRPGGAPLSSLGSLPWEEVLVLGQLEGQAEHFSPPLSSSVYRSYFGNFLSGSRHIPGIL